MSHIGPSTNVYIFFHDSRYGRIWVSGTELIKSKFGEWVLVPTLDDEARNAKSWRYDLAVIAARRFNTEGYLNPSVYQACFTLSPSNSAEEIASATTTSAPSEDNRVIMQYRGLLVRPGTDVKYGRCWFVKFPGQQIESVRGDSPEDAVEKVYERNLQDKAEKFDAPPPEPIAPPATSKGEGRTRPGGLYDKVR
jgi:hypothetical protein